VPVPLTEQGRAEAAHLGRQLAQLPIELCVHTRFARTRDTADEILRGRNVPFVEEPLLDALGLPRPADRSRRLVEAALRARARAVRWLPPRRRPRLRSLERHRSYPHGYELKTVGPPESR